MHVGFPGCAVVENLPANAGNTGSIPGRGNKIPYAVRWSQKKKSGNFKSDLPAE